MGKGIHPSGYSNILVSSIIIILLSTGIVLIPIYLFIKIIAILSAIILILWVVLFFRKPKKIVESPIDDIIYSPAFGEVVVIEKIFEDKYFNEERIQLSIFMSMSSIHLNFMPCNEIIKKRTSKRA